MLRAIILVGLGGGVGSILRYLTSVFVSKYAQTIFPLATFTTNILGCLLIGFFLGLFERPQLSTPDLKFLFITGFCGGYTTFSAFSAENISLLQSGHATTALFYIAISILISLLAVWLGLAISQSIFRIQ